MVVIRRSSSTKRCRPYSLSTHRIGVVQRLNTMSTTGAIGHACSGTTSAGAAGLVSLITMSPSSHYFPLGTYYHRPSSFQRVRRHRQLGVNMIVVTGATGNVGQPLVQALVEAGQRVTAVSRKISPQ